MLGGSGGVVGDDGEGEGEHGKDVGLVVDGGAVVAIRVG